MMTTPSDPIPATEKLKDVEAMRSLLEMQRISQSRNESRTDLTVGNFENFKAAYWFYREKSGYNIAPALSHLAGINFNEKVEVIKMPPPSQLQQFQTPAKDQVKPEDSPNGAYFSNIGVAKPSKLGISDVARRFHTFLKKLTDEAMQRVAWTYEIDPLSIGTVEVLKSTAAPVKDTWSLENTEVDTEGGEIQYFSHEIPKLFFKIPGQEDKLPPFSSEHWDREEVKKLLDNIDFNAIIYRLEDLKAPLSKDPEALKALEKFIDGVKKEHSALIINPKEIKSFIENCQNFAEDALKSSLKKNAEPKGVLGFFNEKIKSLQSVILKQPQEKTEEAVSAQAAYAKIRDIKQKMDKLRKDFEPDTVTPPTISPTSIKGPK